MPELPDQVQALLRALRDEPDGKPALRSAVLDRAAGAPDGAAHVELDGPLVAWVDKVAARAWEITDEDLDAVRRAGIDEDTIFEATVSAAVGAALLRMRAGLRALRGGD